MVGHYGVREAEKEEKSPHRPKKSSQSGRVSGPRRGNPVDGRREWLPRGCGRMHGEERSGGFGGAGRGKRVDPTRRGCRGGGDGAGFYFIFCEEESRRLDCTDVVKNFHSHWIGHGRMR